MTNFMLADLLASARAFLVFAIFLIPPGYMVGWTLQLVGFRSRSLLEKLLLSVPLSIAVAPLTAALLGRYLSPAFSLLFFCAVALASLPLLAVDIRRQVAESGFKMRRSTWVGFGLASLWVVIVLVELVDLQIGQRLYLNVSSFDAADRTAFVQACLRSIPPKNPFFESHGQTWVMRYFYYWYVLCALPCKLAAVPARAALIASSAWCGIAISAIVVLYLKHVVGIKDRLRRISIFALALIAVTGLDLIPVLSLNYSLGDMEWWDADQVTSWFDSLLWVPHHVASLIACLTAFLILWHATQSIAKRARAIAAIVGAVGFASAAGLSVYVTFSFALFMLAWTIALVIRRRWTDLSMSVAAGIGSLVLSIPYLADLRGPGQVGKGFALFNWPTGSPLWDLLVQFGLTGHPWVVFALRIPLLLSHHLFEFGFFFVVLCVCIVRAWGKQISDRGIALWLMVASSLFVASFLRSGVIQNNDLAWRGALLLQFVLLLWGASLVDELWSQKAWRGTRLQKWLAFICLTFLLVGAAGTAYQVTELRLYSLWSERDAVDPLPYLGPETDLGAATYDIRAGFDELARRLPPTTVVQPNPRSWRPTQNKLYSRFQFAASNFNCGTAFGGDPQACKLVLSSVDSLFGPTARMPLADVDRICDDLAINVLVAENTDPVWRVAESWVWTRPPLVANRHFRAVACGSQNR